MNITTQVPTEPITADMAEPFAAELAVAWRAGHRELVESYFARHPELVESSETAVRLIYEEVCLRSEMGEAIDVDAILARFPSFRNQLAIVLDCHQLMLLHSAVPAFPEPGETLGEFRLVRELGRGAGGRVYLAIQASLADRHVVLKVTPRLDREHLSLARLQHTNIIPLYGLYDFADRNLQVACHPYLGGISLDTILNRLAATPIHRAAADCS